MGRGVDGLLNRVYPAGGDLMLVEREQSLEISSYYGLNLKVSPSRLPIGFSREMHDIDLSDPGVAKTNAGHVKLNSYIPPFGNGALELTGAGLESYVSVADHSDFDFSGGTWTVNCSFEVRSLNAAGVIFSQITDANNYKLCRVNADGSIEYKIVSGGSTTVQLLSSASVVSKFTVYQLEIVESGNNFYMFLGLPSAALLTLVASATDADREANYTGAFEIGRVNISGSYQYFVGRIDEFRVSNSARHTSAFAPYAAAFTSDANTKLLIHFDGDDYQTSATDAGGTGHTITFNGGARLHCGQLSFSPTRASEWHIASKNKRKIAIHGGTKIVIMEQSGRWKTAGTLDKSGRIMDFLSVADDLYASDGLNDPKVVQGSDMTMRNWGIQSPSAAPGLVALGVGLLTGTYKYAYSFFNSVTGHESTISPVSEELDVTSNKITISGFSTTTDAQVDKIRIYRTNNGGSIYYFLTEIAYGTGSYSDNEIDDNLDTREGPLYNDPPPKFVGLEEWDGRIFGFEENSTKIKFSNDEYLTPAGSGIPEESYDIDNEIDFKAKVYGIKKSPNFDELWVHTAKGIYGVRKTGIPEDPYYPVIRQSSWYAISHYSITNVLNDQWFIGSNGKVISVDSAGSINYESYNIEPELALGNTALYTKIQGGHYRFGTKNQFLFAYPQSGQVNPNRIAVANYLMRTPPDDFGFTYPVWEPHYISTLCIGVIKDDQERDQLLTGHSDGYIKKHGIGTNYDGVAIDWRFDLGWMRNSKKISDEMAPRKARHYFFPHGSHTFNFDVEYNFGKTVKARQTISAAPTGAAFDSAAFDTAVFADVYDLVKVEKDLGGTSNYMRMIYSDNALNEIMELHNVDIVCHTIEGDR